mgnify:CR=1 FL=1
MVTRDVVQKARERSRAAFEAAHYDGVCTVTTHVKTVDANTKLTRIAETATLIDEPCHLSFEIVRATDQSDSAAALAQAVKLFISPEAAIPTGSKITVTQAGVTGDYTHSSIPAMYETHQEIMLDPFKRWA